MDASSRKTVVIVDNNPANLELLGDVLSKEEYKVIKAQDGKEGLFAARQYSPDLMIIDKELPKLSSYELAEQIKLDERLKSIPLLSVIDSQYKFCDLDIYEDCLTKPLSVKRLLSAIAQIVEDNPKDLQELPQSSKKVS